MRYSLLVVAVSRGRDIHCQARLYAADQCHYCLRVRLVSATSRNPGSNGMSVPLTAATRAGASAGRRDSSMSAADSRG